MIFSPYCRYLKNFSW